MLYTKGARIIEGRISEEPRRRVFLIETRRELRGVSKTYEVLVESLVELDQIVEESQQRLDDSKECQLEEKKKLSQVMREMMEISLEK